LNEKYEMRNDKYQHVNVSCPLFGMKQKALNRDFNLQVLSSQPPITKKPAEPDFFFFILDKLTRQCRELKIITRWRRLSPVESLPQIKRSPIIT